MPKPWLEAGYECHLVDNSFTKDQMELKDGYTRHCVDLSENWIPPLRDYAFVCAFVPCTNTAVSGARWFKHKGIPALIWSLELFDAAKKIIEWSGAPGFIENPVSTFSTYCGKPNHTFNPFDYTGFCPSDNYTKKTCLWSYNGFRMPPKNVLPGLPKPDSRIHNSPPGPNRADIRSITPMGFSLAVFESNRNEECQ